MGFVVAIDGPAGSGKGTVTKQVAEILGLVSIDTGAMYRCVTLKCLEDNIENTDIENINKVLKDIKIELKKIDGIQKVFLDDKDVSEEIRTQLIDANVTKYASIREVREKVTPMQQKMGDTENIIMEGRDIGTTVFPNADVKIYLDASIEERANRRYSQNIKKGLECNYEEIFESIRQRHIDETTRELSPLRQADDAIYLDSSNLSIEEVVSKVVEIVKKRLNK